ncbi:MAG: TatD family hydrolase [Thermoguttaceae bacterium]|nr:TatD family hydrolase [Thermoguttaceae bacterium]
MPNPFIDAHAHLTDAPSAAKLDSVLARAAERSVTVVVTAAARPDDWEPIFRLVGASSADRTGGVRIVGALGIHPWYAASAVPDQEEEFRAGLVRLESPLIGEIGLDFGSKGLAAAPKETQRSLFAAQLALADEMRLPIVVHACRTGGEIFSAIRPFRRIPAVLVHGSVESVPREAVSERFFFSFSAAQTAPDRRRGREAVRRLAASAPEQIVPESDYPAGGREPAGVVETAALLEELGARPSIAAARFSEAFGLFSPK